MARLRRLLLRLPALLIFVTLLSLYVGYAVTLADQNVQTDFAKFYGSARYLLAGTDIYAPVRVDAFGPIPNPEGVTREFHHPNLNLPAAVLFMAPFGLLPYRTAFLLWSLLGLAAGLLAVAILRSAVLRPPRRPDSLLWLWIALLAYFPTFANLQLGQLTLVLLLLLAVTWAAARRGQDALAGIALGLALTLKIFAGLLIVVFLLRRRWRVTLWCLATFAAGALAALVILGPGAYLRYQELPDSITWYAVNWNASFLGFTTRFLGGSDHVPLLDLPRVAWSLAVVLSLLTAGAVLLLAWPRPGNQDPEHFDLAFGLSLAGMLLISPLGWMYYFPVLMLSVLVAWRAARGRFARRTRALLILAWLLTTIPTPLIPAESVSGPVAWLTWASLDFYALLLLTGVMAWLAARHRGLEVASPP